MVIPLHECIARPPEGERTFPLLSHLETVASGMGKADGTPFQRLSFLAGWMHDVGKAHAKWQWYIRDPSQRKGPPHAVYGAVLFVYVASHLMRIWQSAEGDEQTWVARIQWLCRDIMDHHGRLGDLTPDEPPWSGRTLEWHAIDLKSVGDHLCRKFPEVASLPFDAEAVERWAAGFRRRWYAWYDDWAGAYEAERYQRPLRAWAAHCLRVDTATLIRADRFDAAGIQPRAMTREEVDQALARLARHVAQTVSAQPQTDVHRLRDRIAREALQRYQETPDAPAYVLRVPTGYGKTLTGLRIALEIARHRGAERIVYVAPYLSLLSQSAQVISEATGLEVMVHHGLSLADVFSGNTGTGGASASSSSQDTGGEEGAARTSNRNATEEGSPSRGEDEHALLLLESWQAPIVVTTFNQFFRALFPARAQDTLRLHALHGAVVFIDEPQIVDHTVWSPFLAQLQTAMDKMGVVCVFSTATLPPLVPGLDAEPVHLEPPGLVYPPRYQVVYEDKVWNESDLIHVLCTRERDTRSLAVMMNTIGDAVRVWESVDAALEEYSDRPCLYTLHGLMTPLHKRMRLAEIRQTLDGGERVWVVTTQALEAGVDVSFHAVYRALPIFSSVVQAAGRVNRHGEGPHLGRICVFRFAREGGQDTRPYVYRDAISREETDHSMARVAGSDEIEMYREIEAYFERILRKRDGQAALEALRRAAQGAWSQVAGWAPFADDGWRIPVFVPWGDAVWKSGADPRVQRLMQAFSLERAEQIYERYLDLAWVRGLSMVERKRFMGLMQQFIVEVPPRLAVAITANFADEVVIKRVADIGAYEEEAGFGRVAVHGLTDLLFA
ncbi:CRISPR-associated helicase Cas3/CRISPR-associated endonuclease Cas3-HD [Alicyclobacillus macrosporangiidus]|uniref:CRISPR-associated helicase Cas3/CRISPR-associated endonuclease Cas3-HD n=1 Tax=Alicyclobacillus macrosporangiidus TaxID=392015 RepID=A0A1I7K457_9BACL|nr:CRISPR-associated helicase Cas3/CRISPR-associated endonuclease Cas3-HD [Alicyclobacillus macrosporangiidus]